MSSLAAFNRVMRVLQTYANVPASEVRALADELDDLTTPGASSTAEALTIPVDYNLVGAIDVPTGSVFARQSDVTKALGTATAFKYLQQCYDALPPLVAHAVTFNLAAGIHRPHPTNPGGGSNLAWSFGSKTVNPNGSISFIGAAPSLWNAKPFVPTNMTITGTQVASGDPWVDVSGTPFTVPAWAATTAYVVGDRVLNNSNTYICRVAGTSAGSGGPSGSASNILD
ncbi:MAG TPA: carbohydrate-binding protein, partial [Gammaproteobacteria bacterium]|nr:carbohydrate-binding protein [Gammaproteobacteria bacterium]